MDIRMPGTDGLAATRQIAADQRLADVRVVILTTFELDEYVFEAIRSGPPGSWSKTPTRTSSRKPCEWSRTEVPCSPPGLPGG